MSPTTTASRNYIKNTTSNPLQRWLLDNFHHRVAELVDEVLPVGGTILDVGCGEGFVADFLGRRLPNLHVTGLDFSQEALVTARDMVGDARFARSDAGRLPIAEDAVDLGLCLEVLEHLIDPDRTLDELNRISKRAVIVSTPNQPFFAGANLARLKNLATLGDDPEHVQWWTGPAFVRRVAEHLDVERVVYSLPWTIVLARPKKATIDRG